MVTARALEAYFKRKEKERSERREKQRDRSRQRSFSAGIAAGRAEMATEFNNWLRRRDASMDKGEDFNEPPPSPYPAKSSSSDGAREIVGAAVVAGGESRRMGGMDKLFAPILGKPLLLYCLETLQRSERVHRIAIAASASSVHRVERLAKARGITKLTAVAPGGERRQDSVSNALDALGDVAIAIVHDGARPFLDLRMIADAVDAAIECRAASAAVPVKDTIKIAAPDMTVADTPPRDTLWAAQTPQAFCAELLREAHRRIRYDVTDDAAIVEALCHPVKLFMGAYANIKVTTPEDIPIAEAIARNFAPGTGAGTGE